MDGGLLFYFFCRFEHIFCIFVWMLDGIVAQKHQKICIL